MPYAQCWSICDRFIAVRLCYFIYLLYCSALLRGPPFKGLCYGMAPSVRSSVCPSCLCP